MKKLLFCVVIWLFSAASYAGVVTITATCNAALDSKCLNGFFPMGQMVIDDPVFDTLAVNEGVEILFSAVDAFSFNLPARPPLFTQDTVDFGLRDFSIAFYRQDTTFDFFIADTILNANTGTGGNALCFSLSFECLDINADSVGANNFLDFRGFNLGLSSIFDVVWDLTYEPGSTQDVPEPGALALLGLGLAGLGLARRKRT